MIRTLKAFTDKTRNICSDQDSVSGSRFLHRSFGNRHVRLGESHQSLGCSQPRWPLVSSAKFRSCLYSYSIGIHRLTLNKSLESAKVVSSSRKFAPAWLLSSPWPTSSVSMPLSPLIRVAPVFVLQRARPTFAILTLHTSYAYRRSNETL